MATENRKPPTRWTLGDVREFIGQRARLADDRPSGAMVTNREPLNLVCAACGYEWPSCKESLSKGRWCPRCTGCERWTYARARQYAAERGGQVESDLPDKTMCGTHVPMQCAEGHRWPMPRKCFDASSWCPKCSARQRGKQARKTHLAKHVRKIIGKRGRLLDPIPDDEPVSHTRRVRVECSQCKHVWSPSFGVIHRGGWCPHCAGNRRWTIGRVRALVSQRGGKVISDSPDTDVIVSKGYVTVECGMGHRWSVRPANLKAGYWCPKCCGRSEWTLGRVRAIVEGRGGQLLAEGPDSQPIVAHRFVAHVRCALGHEWTTNTSRLAKSWCGECASGQGEEICRAYMEAMFGRPFPKCRPMFLKYKQTGRNLELDGFCEELSIAFEHHGLQHYEEVSLFKDSRISLSERKRRDRLKRRRCAARGVVLVEVPELHLKTPLSKLREFIIEQCTAAGRQVPFPDAEVDATQLVAVSSINLAIERAKEFAESKGGQCLSTAYLGKNQKLRWRCDRGHEWEAPHARVVNGRAWCPECGKDKCREATRHRLGWYEGLERCKRYAESKGGEVLSTEYRGVRRRLIWRCALGHTFHAEPFQLLPKPSLKGGWCRECTRLSARAAMNERLLARCQRHAQSLGGEMLSASCDGHRQAVKWQCKCGSRWMACPASVFGSRGRPGTWCPRCGREKAERNRQRTMKKQRGFKFGKKRPAD